MSTKIRIFFCMSIAILMAMTIMWITASRASTARPSPTQSPFTTQRAQSDDEVFVPAGPFSMGCATDNCYDLCDGDARPIHTVYLDAFFIDRFEVTNAQYRACEAAGVCPHPVSDASATRPHYYTDPIYNDYPVINVDWNMANTYCHWVGKRLPTEAEWEKAARGTDLRWFSWGNEAIDCQHANYRTGLWPNEHDCIGDTMPVGSYPLNVSPYGALDMIGNVREWVADIYDSPYYENSPYYNPRGPAGTDKNEHLLRGGSWADNWRQVTTYVRLDESETYKYLRNGFRCARSWNNGPFPTPTPAPTPFASLSIGPEGGLLWLAQDDENLTVLKVPPGAVTATTLFTISTISPANVMHREELQSVGPYVHIEAETMPTTCLQLVAAFHPPKPILPGSLALYHLEDSRWVSQSITVTERGFNFTIGDINELGTFALFGESLHCYLPIVLRGH